MQYIRNVYAISHFKNCWIMRYLLFHWLPPHYPYKNHQSQSHVCAVAQNAVLEAIAKVNGRCKNSHHHPSETPRLIGMPFQIQHYVPKATDKQNLTWINSDISAMCICEKSVWMWMLAVYLHVSIAFFIVPTDHNFGAILTCNGSKRCIFTTISALGVSLINLYLGGQSPQKTIQKWAWIGHFQAKPANIKTCMLSKYMIRLEPNFAQ